MRNSSIFVAFFLLAVFCSCGSHYELVGVNRSRILIDERYDKDIDTKAQNFMAPYKAQVDSIMSPVVGHVASYMWAERPESNLSNLLADVLMWAATNYNERPQFAVYNMGGIRAALSEGIVTYGNVLDVAPFENKICFFDMKGSDVLTLFRQIAHNRGEGVSHELRLIITKKGELVSATINGQAVDENATYRVASIDYLAQGNDGLAAFKNKSNLNSPQDANNNLRFVIMDYFRANEEKGVVTDAKVEGRITVKE